MAPRVKRRTPRCDANGNVLEDFRGLYETTALAAARKAGVPSDLLDPAGWNGDGNDTCGYYADQIYRLGEISFTAPDAIEQIADVIDAMQQICRGLGVDPKAAIPYSLARFKRQLHEASERRLAISEGYDLPLNSEAGEAFDTVVVGEWACPSGPGHDDHGHGLSNGAWRCLGE